MSESNPGLEHAARGLSDGDRVDYLIAVASMAFADAHVDDSEIAVLHKLCQALDVSGPSEQSVIDAARSPDPAKVDGILREIGRDVGLRVSLLADAILVAFADGKLDGAETALVARFAEKLSVSTGQAVMIARYVEAALTPDGLLATERESKSFLSASLAQGLTAEWQARPRPSVVRWLFGALGGKGKTPSSADSTVS
jgi:uncharacterized tellurite resistance protein B-like protein